MRMRLRNNLELLPTQEVAHHPHPTPLGRMTETLFFCDSISNSDSFLILKKVTPRVPFDHSNTSIKKCKA